MNIYVDKDFKFGWAEQSAFGTKVVASMTELECEPFEFKPTTNTLELNRAHQQRYAKDGDTIVDTKGALHELTPPAFLAKKDEVDQFLYMVFQNVAENATTPFEKVFTFGQTQPDFAGDAGHFMTFGASSPESSEDWTIVDTICRTLTLSCAPNDQNGYMTANAELIARSFNQSDAITSINTVADGAIADFYNWHDLTAQVDSTDLVLGPNGVQIAITNSANKVGSDAAGLFQSYVLGMYGVTYTAQFLYDASTIAALVLWLANTAEADHTLSWGTGGGADGDLDFAFNGKYTDWSHQLTQDGVYATLTMKCSGTYGSTEPITVTHSNAVDRGW